MKVLALFILAASVAAAQKPTDVTVKDTPASQTLVQIAKQKIDDQKVLDTKFQQARSNLDSSNKAIQDQLKAVSDDLQNKLKADKKYKPMLDQIADLQKKLGENGSNAQQAFQRDIGPVQQKVQMETNQVDGLIPIVRKENGLPDTATFDGATGKWSVPEVKK